MLKFNILKYILSNLVPVYLNEFFFSWFYEKNYSKPNIVLFGEIFFKYIKSFSVFTGIIVLTYFPKELLINFSVDSSMEYIEEFRGKRNIRLDKNLHRQTLVFKNDFG